jgi:glycosyltransferase involved in cell wall biosynthesis
MRRILHLTDSWGPGGAETVFAELASGLDATRFESIVGLPRASDWLFDEVRQRGLDPVIFPSSGSFDLGHLRRLVSFVRNHGIDVIQAHTFGTSVYASAAGLIARVPVVCTLHGRVDLALSQRHRKIKWEMIRAGAARIVCVSRALKDELHVAAPRLDPAKIAVVYNGVNVTAFRPGPIPHLELARSTGSEKVVIGAVGNVRRIKGYEVLLAAAAELSGRGIPTHFLVAGQADNDVYRELEATVRDLALTDQVEFLGFRNDAAELYRRFDIYALTSHSEGFPLSTIQALASGIPVVATRCGGPEEMIDQGVDGFLVERGSGHAVADALAELALNPELRARMGKAAREKAVSRFSTQSMLAQYEELYETLARRSRRAATAVSIASADATG